MVQILHRHTAAHVHAHNAAQIVHCDTNCVKLTCAKVYFMHTLQHMKDEHALRHTVVYTHSSFHVVYTHGAVQVVCIYTHCGACVYTFCNNTRCTCLRYTQFALYLDSAGGALFGVLFDSTAHVLILLMSIYRRRFLPASFVNSATSATLNIRFSSNSFSCIVRSSFFFLCYVQ